MAVLSIWFTDQPQRWAVVPAVFMAVSGALVLWAPNTVVDALGWVWPPALVVLVAWVWTRARRELHSRTRVWLLNPMLVVLVLFALGGAYERVSQSIAPAVACAVNSSTWDRTGFIWSALARAVRPSFLSPARAVLRRQGS